jgi:hypothetical protein
VAVSICPLVESMITTVVQVEDVAGGDGYPGGGIGVPPAGRGQFGATSLPIRTYAGWSTMSGVADPLGKGVPSGWIVAGYSEVASPERIVTVMSVRHIPSRRQYW